MKNHPLFPEAAEADIECFHVTRHAQGGGGVEWSATPHKPEDVTELSQILELYGGGHYELVARGMLAGKAGEKGRKGINARQTYRLAGDPKPLNPTAVAPAPVPHAPAAPVAPTAQTDLGAILAYMGQQQSAQMSLMGTIITAALSNRGGEDKGTAAAIQALGDVVKATLERRPEVVAASSSVDPLKMFMDLGDWFTGARATMQAAAEKASRGEDNSVDLNSVMGAFDKAVDVIKKAKTLGQEGKTHAEAADELAAQAAE